MNHLARITTGRVEPGRRVIDRRPRARERVRRRRIGFARRVSRDGCRRASERRHRRRAGAPRAARRTPSKGRRDAGTRGRARASVRSLERLRRWVWRVKEARRARRRWPRRSRLRLRRAGVSRRVLGVEFGDAEVNQLSRVSTALNPKDAVGLWKFECVFRRGFNALAHERRSLMNL